MVANEVLRDKNLSFKAKGMYAYLFSKPDEWDFSSNRMILETTDRRDAIMGMLKELEENGYLKRDRLPNGKMQYTIKHSLSGEIQLRVEKPKSGKPTVGKTHSGKIQPISNTVLDTNTEKKVTLNFDLFWNKYPRREGKVLAEKAWLKISPSEELVSQILSALEKHKRSPQWVKDGGQFIPHPTTWLNQKRWEDEIKLENVKAYQFKE